MKRPIMITTKQEMSVLNYLLNVEKHTNISSKKLVDLLITCHTRPKNLTLQISMNPLPILLKVWENPQWAKILKTKDKTILVPIDSINFHKIVNINTKAQYKNVILCQCKIKHIHLQEMKFSIMHKKLRKIKMLNFKN